MQIAKKVKEREKKQTEASVRKKLGNVRVIQRNLVYVTNLALSAATEETLKRDYFGRFGKIKKVVVNRNNVYQGPQGPSVCAYITYFRPKDAHDAIKAVDGTVLDGRLLRASFGTTKYCSYFLRNVRCPNPECMYLHELGADVDSFTKEDMAQGKHLMSNVTLRDDEDEDDTDYDANNRRTDLSRSGPAPKPKQPAAWKTVSVGGPFPSDAQYSSSSLPASPALSPLNGIPHSSPGNSSSTSINSSLNPDEWPDPLSIKDAKLNTKKNKQINHRISPSMQHSSLQAHQQHNQPQNQQHILQDSINLSPRTEDDLTDSNDSPRLNVEENEYQNYNQNNDSYMMHNHGYDGNSWNSIDEDTKLRDMDYRQYHSYHAGGLGKNSYTNHAFNSGDMDNTPKRKNHVTPKKQTEWRKIQSKPTPSSPSSINGSHSGNSANSMQPVLTSPSPSLASSLPTIGMASSPRSPVQTLDGVSVPSVAGVFSNEISGMGISNTHNGAMDPSKNFSRASFPDDDDGTMYRNSYVYHYNYPYGNRLQNSRNRHFNDLSQHEIGETSPELLSSSAGRLSERVSKPRDIPTTPNINAIDPSSPSGGFLANNFSSSEPFSSVYRMHYVQRNRNSPSEFSLELSDSSTSNSVSSVTSASWSPHHSYPLSPHSSAFQFGRTQFPGGTGSEELSVSAPELGEPHDLEDWLRVKFTDLLLGETSLNPSGLKTTPNENESSNPSVDSDNNNISSGSPESDNTNGMIGKHVKTSPDNLWAENLPIFSSSPATKSRFNFARDESEETISSTNNNAACTFRPTTLFGSEFSQYPDQTPKDITQAAVQIPSVNNSRNSLNITSSTSISSTSSGNSPIVNVVTTENASFTSTQLGSYARVNNFTVLNNIKQNLAAEIPADTNLAEVTNSNVNTRTQPHAFGAKSPVKNSNVQSLQRPTQVFQSQTQFFNDTNSLSWSSPTSPAKSQPKTAPIHIQQQYSPSKFTRNLWGTASAPTYQNHTTNGGNFWVAPHATAPQAHPHDHSKHSTSNKQF